MVTFRAGLGCALAAALATSALAAPSALADPIQETQGLRKALTVPGIQEHLGAFQSHADLNGGTRAAGSPGYEASANYVAARAQAAGYEVRSSSFTFPYNADRTPAAFQRISPAPRTFTDGVEFASMTFSSNGDSTAPLTAVDLVLAPGSTVNVSTSGCEAADFAGFPAGSIALMQRGTCGFVDKVNNAKAAGASGAVVFNEGTAPDRLGPVNGTLGGPGSYVPSVGTSFAIGVELANGVASGPTGVTARVRVDRVSETRTTRNVIAETPGGDPSRVVVVGAHLDSVPRGPGINDNGTGSASILETAEVLSQRGIAPRNKVRFMWYSAEEFGLLGSTAYVAGLPAAERERIKAMLNFDMVGSPNYVRFVYDGDNSAFPVGPGAADGPQGSGELERIFHAYFTSQGLASDETPFSGRSDYGPFIAQGIPAGGLFTGAEGVKTEAQAAVYGGTAGEPYDACYHLACDTLANVSAKGLDEMSDAIGHSVLTVAKRDLVKDPLVDPAGPVTGTGGTTPGGGGLHDEHDHEADPR